MRESRKSHFFMSVMIGSQYFWRILRACKCSNPDNYRGGILLKVSAGSGVGRRAGKHSIIRVLLVGREV